MSPQPKTGILDLRRFQKTITELGIDVIIASTPENIFYSSGLPVMYNATNNILFILRNRDVTLVVIPRGTNAGHDNQRGSSNSGTFLDYGPDNVQLCTK